MYSSDMGTLVHDMVPLQEELLIERWKTTIAALLYLREVLCVFAHLAFTRRHLLRTGHALQHCRHVGCGFRLGGVDGEAVLELTFHDRVRTPVGASENTT